MTVVNIADADADRFEREMLKQGCSPFVTSIVSGRVRKLSQHNFRGTDIHGLTPEQVEEVHRSTESIVRQIRPLLWAAWAEAATLAEVMRESGMESPLRDDVPGL